MQADSKLDTDYAWAAGFFDGEGTVSIRKGWNNRLMRHQYSCTFVFHKLLGSP